MGGAQQNSVGPLLNPKRSSAPVAQLAARGSHNPKVASSTLAGSSVFFFVLIIFWVYTASVIQKKKRGGGGKINKNNSHRGARTHDHKIKSLALYQLS